MKLYFIPKWVDDLRHTEGLSWYDLLNRDVMSRYLAHRELQTYSSFWHKAEHMFVNRIDLLRESLASLGMSWGDPIPAPDRLDYDMATMGAVDMMNSNEATFIDDAFGGYDTRLFYPGYRTHLHGDTTDAGEPILFIVATLCPITEEPETPTHWQLLSQSIMEALYENGCTLPKLARTSFFKSFLNGLH